MSEAADRPSTGMGVLPLLRKAISYELGMWRSLYRWVLRRPVTAGPEAVAFGYAALLTPVFLAFIAVSSIEVPILHLLIGWETVRLVVDALGCYGLFWMLGLLASVRVHPHIVSDSGLRVRNGLSVDVTVAWEVIATIRTRRRSLASRRTVHCERSKAAHIVHIGVLSQTNIDVVLREPAVLGIAKTNGEAVTEVRFYVDDPAAFLARAREHLAAPSR